MYEQLTLRYGYFLWRDMMVLASESADEIIWCDYSMKPLQQYFHKGTIHISVFYKLKFGICLEF